MVSMRRFELRPLQPLMLLPLPLGYMDVLVGPRRIELRSHGLRGQRTNRCARDPWWTASVSIRVLNV